MLYRGLHWAPDLRKHLSPNSLDPLTMHRKLIGRARSRTFRSILRQDMSFFDTDEITSGSLSSFLATEPNRLAGFSGAILGSLLTATATIFGGFAIAASFGWKLALVSAATIPALIVCGFWRFQVCCISST
jgi:ATP-binding cassette subfamily B (MDR/TAP) protein 1